MADRFLLSRHWLILCCVLLGLLRRFDDLRLDEDAVQGLANAIMQLTGNPLPVLVF
jgi:hypothetical protein